MSGLKETLKKVEVILQLCTLRDDLNKIGATGWKDRVVEIINTMNGKEEEPEPEMTDVEYLRDLAERFFTPIQDDVDQEDYERLREIANFLEGIEQAP